MKTILLFLAIALSIHLNAQQVTRVKFQATGLTCSMCSNAINKSLKTLDFVDQIKSDLHNYTFELSFKSGSNVDFEKVKEKVEDAGFFVSSFWATVFVKAQEVNAGYTLKLNDDTFLFRNITQKKLTGEVEIKFLDKGFVSAKEFKSGSKFYPQKGIYNVTL